MLHSNKVRVAGCLGASLLVLASGVFLTNLGCNGTAAFVINGPPGIGNEPPTLTIIEPTLNITRSQGAPFLIRWVDTDRDDNALISFSLLNTFTNQTILLVDGIEEDDTKGPDNFTVQTSLIPVGKYNLFGTISDGVNPPVTVFAVLNDPSQARVEITITEEGQAPPTSPPTVVVLEPSFNLSVAQDDILTVIIQPTAVAPPPPDAPGPPPIPYDSDSNVTLYIVLDLDANPNNDDPANPQRDSLGNLTREDLIVLQTQTIAAGTFQPIQFNIQVTLEEIPPRPNGEPYFIRATLDDLQNPRVHRYAPGTISVSQLASGMVDLSQIGKTISGCRFYGFNPGANLGSSISTVRDFDNDGIDDFVLVAQFGNPRNFGLVGEAYLVYGLDRIRFGGDIAANSVASVVSGVVFEGPPIRQSAVTTGATTRTDGITSVSFIPDITGDNRPEILFGLARVHGAFEAMDWDPGDENLAAQPVTTDITIQVRDGFHSINNVPNIVSPVTVQDTTISSAVPTVSQGSGDLFWKNNGPADTEMTLIKFTEVLSIIPDSLATIDITTLQAQLRVRVFRPGGNANIFRSITNFTEATTWNTYSSTGGAPTAGVDYDDNVLQGLGTVTAESSQVVVVDITPIVADLIEGNLLPSSNEIRLILVPTTGESSALQTGIRSSEYQINPADRPTLIITYTRSELVGGLGCYPDPFVNNLTNPRAGLNEDNYLFFGGMVTMLSSQNRDVAGPINVNRLESTTVALELVGAHAGFVLDRNGVNQQGGGISAQASNALSNDLGTDPTAEPNRIAGARFVAGGFDDFDADLLSQPPREDLFGKHDAWIPDMTFDGLPEIIISSPRNELHLNELTETFGGASTHLASTRFRGSVTVIPGFNYNSLTWRDVNSTGGSTSTIPTLDHWRVQPGNCGAGRLRTLWAPSDRFEVLAENREDFLGQGQYAGDFNQDGVPDILCAAPLNNRGSLENTGAVYILYGKAILGDYNLAFADNPVNRPPMLRIRGSKPGDQLGFSVSTGLDVNGDRIDDVFFSSPTADFGGITRSVCGVDANGDGLVTTADFDTNTFNQCRAQFGTEVFTDDLCKIFDYDNDGDIDDDDFAVFQCLQGGGGSSCCANLVDNGVVGVVFGGIYLDGDRTLEQLATSQLPGAIFYGANAGDRAGYAVSSAGDFNQDGFGDILISAPGEVRVDSANRPRKGVVYLIFGGTHLHNKVFNLAQVGSPDLPGIVFLSPYVAGRPNEAAPLTVALLGDINNDGFDDIAIGNPKADFIDLSFPQGPDAPGSDAAVGRRSNAGDVYIIYGNNFGTNRLTP